MLSSRCFASTSFQVQFVKLTLQTFACQCCSGVDDRVSSGILKGGVRNAVLGHAIGNAMSVSVVERLMGRMLYSLDILKALPEDRWQVVQMKCRSKSKAGDFSGYWSDVQARSKLVLKKSK